MITPSGAQHVLRHGNAEAVITEVGAGLRTLRVGAIDVIDGYGVDEQCSGGRGQTLLPWPNRVRDGQWSWNGEDYQLPLTEPSKHNASHGLTRWANWQLAERSADTVRLIYQLHAQPGWPFLLQCEIAYALGEIGLTVSTTMTNVGSSPCPVAAGAHPYLAAGGGLVDDCLLELPGGVVIPVDDRGLPVGRRDVAPAEDFRSPSLIGTRVLDLAYGDLHPGPDGRTVARLARPDGMVLELWAGSGYRYLQVFTGDTLSADRRRRGVAVEPMTAPANALQTGQDLDRLEPGGSLTLRWGVGLDPG